MLFFFFNDTATTEIYTLSLHDALPIFVAAGVPVLLHGLIGGQHGVVQAGLRSEEHTSELQSQSNLVCRLLLEKKKIILNAHPYAFLQLAPRRTMMHNDIFRTVICVGIS